MIQGLALSHEPLSLLKRLTIEAYSTVHSPEEPCINISTRSDAGTINNVGRMPHLRFASKAHYHHRYDPSIISIGVPMAHDFYIESQEYSAPSSLTGKRLSRQHHSVHPNQCNDA
jgi:hypothetical protein